MRILVASDLTACSDRALGRAYGLAQELNAELHIVHVVNAGLPAEFRQHSIDWATKALLQETDRVKAATGIVANTSVIAGHPAADIVKLAAAGPADLVVLGVHDPSARGIKAFADTTAGRILKASLTAALLVRNDATEPYRQAVVGVDFSMFSRAAIRQALQIAPAACLHLVHAYHVPFKGFLGSRNFVAEVAHEQRLELDAYLHGEMDALQRRAMGTVPGGLETYIQEGTPQEVLRDSCMRVGADLLVIATQGRATVSRAIWGSVAADLLEQPPCDVLVVQPF